MALGFSNTADHEREHPPRGPILSRLQEALAAKVAQQTVE
jgi:hypothetical protein